MRKSLHKGNHRLYRLQDAETTEDMAKKTKKVKNEDYKSAEELATLLGEVRTRIAADKKLDETLTKVFKLALEREKIRKAGNYALTKSTTFKVAVEELALPFALERGLVKIDTGKIHDVFRMDASLRFEDPERYGFEAVTQERIVPMKKSDAE